MIEEYIKREHVEKILHQVLLRNYAEAIEMLHHILSTVDARKDFKWDDYDVDL